MSDLHFYSTVDEVVYLKREIESQAAEIDALTARNAANADHARLANESRKQTASALKTANAEIARLRGVLENIRDHAISNGEDCAYLDAKAALKETER